MRLRTMHKRKNRILNREKRGKFLLAEMLKINFVRPEISEIKFIYENAEILLVYNKSGPLDSDQFFNFVFGKPESPVDLGNGSFQHTFLGDILNAEFVE